VGGAAQIKAMKKVAGALRINLAQYRELAVFAQFGSDLDKVTKDKLIQGERLVESLKQSRRATMPVEDQVIVLYMATNKYLMDLPVKEVRSFNKEFVKFVNSNYPEIPNEIRATGDLSSETENMLKKAAEEFKDQYLRTKR